MLPKICSMEPKICAKGPKMCGMVPKMCGMVSKCAAWCQKCEACGQKCAAWCQNFMTWGQKCAVCAVCCTCIVNYKFIKLAFYFFKCLGDVVTFALQPQRSTWCLHGVYMVSTWCQINRNGHSSTVKH